MKILEIVLTAIAVGWSSYGLFLFGRTYEFRKNRSFHRKQLETWDTIKTYRDKTKEAYAEASIQLSVAEKLCQKAQEMLHD